jgi:hypothetical protein
MNRSAGAFILNMEQLIPFLSVGRSRKRFVYMWTFTSPDVINPKETSRRWNNLLRAFKREWPGMPLLRVFELHPGGPQGFSHGVHIHALLPFRLGVDRVRELSTRVGFGRIHAKVLEANKAQAYLAKYLIKERKNRHGILKGLQLWGAINMEKKTLVKNVVKVNFASFYCKRHLPALQDDFYASLHYVQRAFPTLRPVVKKYLGNSNSSYDWNNPKPILEAFHRLYPKKPFHGTHKVNFLSKVLFELYFPLLTYYVKENIYTHAWIYPKLEPLDNVRLSLREDNHTPKREEGKSLEEMIEDKIGTRTCSLAQ